MAKLHARPSNQYRYEHYDPWGGGIAGLLCSACWKGIRFHPSFRVAGSAVRPSAPLYSAASTVQRQSASSREICR